MKIQILLQIVLIFILSKNSIADIFFTIRKLTILIIITFLIVIIALIITIYILFLLIITTTIKYHCYGYYYIF